MNPRAIQGLVENNPEILQEAQEAMQRLLSRSATDMEFRQLLLTDPHTAMEQEAGQPVPRSFNLCFIENTVDVTIVLPDPVDEEVELTEAELEAVAGGILPLIVATVMAAGAGWYVSRLID